MQVRCPHCGSVFASGHSGVQSCPFCHREIHVPEVEDPKAPVLEQREVEQVLEAEQPNAWERRNELGRFRALWLTWKEVMFSPTLFWKQLRPGGSLWDAVLFAWLVLLLPALVSTAMIPLSLRQHAWTLWTQNHQLPERTQEVLNWLVRSGGLYFLQLAQIVFFPLLLIAVSGLVHVACKVCGCGQNGFTATSRALAYSFAPMLFASIPCLGLFALLYMSVLQVWGLARVHRADAGRVVLAFTLLTLVLCCLCGAASALLFGALARGFAATQQL